MLQKNVNAPDGLTVTSTTPSNPTNDDDDGLSGLEIGLIVGVSVLGVALIAMIVGCIVMRKKGGSGTSGQYSALVQDQSSAGK